MWDGLRWDEDGGGSEEDEEEEMGRRIPPPPPPLDGGKGEARGSGREASGDKGGGWF